MNPTTKGDIMNKLVVAKVVGTHALIVGASAAAATIVIDLVKLSKS